MNQVTNELKNPDKFRTEEVYMDMCKYDCLCRGGIGEDLEAIGGLENA